MKNNIDVLIVTTGHHPQDGRLRRHQACLERYGFKSEIHAITSSNRFQRFFISPFKAYGAIKRYKPKCVILPDPELHLWLPRMLRKRLAVISDVHENYREVRFDRSWIRSWIIPLIKIALRAMEANRFLYSHCVITADTSICPDADFEVTNFPHPDDLPPPLEESPKKNFVYVGDLRKSRGLDMMLNLAEEVKGFTLHLVGPTLHTDLDQTINDRGLKQKVIWHGRKDYRASWELARDCLAGLSLLEDTKAFRHACPTKIWEYWTVGIPVIATPLPGQSQMIAETGAGIAAEFDKIKETVQEWIDSPQTARALGAKGRAYVLEGSTQRDLVLPQAIKYSMKKFGEICQS